MMDFLRGLNTVAIAGTLFVLMVLAIETGYRVGLRFTRESSDAARSHVGAVLSSLLGILALLLGFTFSLALQRFDSRSVALVEEANAIGTSYLRAALLPEAIRGDAQKMLRDYIALRVEDSFLMLVEVEKRTALQEQTNRQLDALWRLAVAAAEQDPNPVRTGFFVQSLNETIDAYGLRQAALGRHVPVVVLFLLAGVFLMAGGVLGYSTGVAGHRPSLAAHLLIVLIVVLVFIIIDLDRPRRGLILVDQTSLIDLKKMVEAEQGAAAVEASAR